MPTQSPFVVLAWEFGGGLGHVLWVKHVSDFLRKAGASVHVLVPSGSYRQHFSSRASIINLREGFGRRRLRQTPDSRAWAGYGDMMADSEFCSEAEIAERLGYWRGLLKDARADLLIADFAPMSLLAARGICPAIGTGVGYTTPPASMTDFPIIRSGWKKKHDEKNVLTRINAALAVHGLAPIGAYPQVNACDRQAVLSMPALDPYAQFRISGWLGGEPMTASAVSYSERSGVFATFRENMQLDERLIGSLVSSGLGGCAVFPNPLRRTRKRLEPAGFEVPEAFLDMNVALEKHRVLFHHGGHGTCLAGLAKGLPQLIVYADLEKQLYGEMLKAAGCGISLPSARTGERDIREALVELHGNEKYTKCARALADDNRHHFAGSAMERLAAHAAFMLKLGPAPPIH